MSEHHNDCPNHDHDHAADLKKGVEFTADIATMAQKRKMSPEAMVIAFANGLACHIATCATIQHVMGGLSVAAAATAMEDDWPDQAANIIHNARHKFYVGMANLPEQLRAFNERHPEQALSDDEIDNKGI
ncbi:MAG: hypothetical protein V3S98_06135 [Dehalococcoidia bacterium]